MLPLSHGLQEVVRHVSTLSVSVIAANGTKRTVKLTEESISRLRGDNVGLSWIDDESINGLVYLINERNKRSMDTRIRCRSPPKDQDLFHRTRVRAHVFGTHFYTIWKRSVHGGYESLKKWRRKISNYNSIRTFMFPAFIHGSHWVLAVVDVVGGQYIYYDPLGSKDTEGVMRCATEWMAGEVRSANRNDAFHGLDLSNWAEVQNPASLPRQMDLESCGVFVIFVAEHLERGVKPSFTQRDIPLLRSRAIAMLHQGFAPDSDDIHSI